jgi:hypothetical protein
MRCRSVKNADQNYRKISSTEQRIRGADYILLARSALTKRTASGKKKISRVVGRCYAKNHRTRYPEHSNARWEVCNAVKEGRLEKLKWCQCCGKAAGEKKVEAHHASYEKKHWLDVVWLCKEHHAELHEWLKNQKQ